jgi:hypothetical protein
MLRSWVYDNLQSCALQLDCVQHYVDVRVAHDAVFLCAESNNGV